MTISTVDPKILVVDDDFNLLDAVRRTLRRLRPRWEVELARGAEEAFEALEHAPLPDLVLCDIAMPGTDGYALLERLRGSTETATLSFIFLTGNDSKAHLRRGMALGADDYLTKPFQDDDLVAAIEARLQRKVAVEQRSRDAFDELRHSITYALPHELRTPLTGILGLSGIIEESCSSMAPEEIAALAAMIHQSAGRLHRLVENFLVFAQLELVARDEGKRARLWEEHTDQPAEIIAEIARQTAHSFDRDEDLSLELTDAPVRISAMHLQKIVTELLDNALRYSPPGTPVTIRSGSAEDALTISIEDQGRGMTPADVASQGAFTQFGRSLYEQQGAGLGLAIARRLIELHRGKLDIESRRETSTTVRVSLPRAL